jgi:hypothetical protein
MSHDDDDVDLGEAAEGGAYIVEEDAPVSAPPPTAVSRGEGEPADQIEGETGADSTEGVVDADQARATMMRAARMRARTAAINSAKLPLIPQSAQPAQVVSQSGTVLARRRRVVVQRTNLQECARCCRIAMQWKILKHLIAASILPFLTIIGLIIYFQLPSNLTFGEALIRGDLKTVKYYLEVERLPLNSPLEGDPQDRSPLHLACIGNHTSLVRELVFRGAMLDVTDENGFTPLHYASNVLNAEMSDFLIAQGAPVDAKDVNQRTPLHIAAITGSVPVLAVLVFNGNADLKAADIDNHYATDYSRAFHASSMQKLLDDGYYHDHKGEMKVISHDKFEAMRKREGVASSSGDSSSSNKARGPSKTKGKKGGKQQQQLPVVQATEKSGSSARGSTQKVDPAATPAAVEDDDSFMSLFTGDRTEDATKQRYERDTAAATRHEAQAREAVEELDSLSQGGAQVDSDEFEV